MFLSLLASVAAVHSSAGATALELKTVAILPWIYRGGTNTAMKTANDALDAFFDKAKCDRQSKVKVVSAWEEAMGKSNIKEVGEENDPMPDLPNAKDLLALGKKMGVDYVCAGRAKWHTKSVWISLGPKTKADCTVDVELVDVHKEELALNQTGIKADDTRRESGLETAAAILVSMGFTAFSGGPKTPHQQKAVVNALGLAFEPWLKTMVDNKIK